jgi:hypothetical protein
MQSAKWLQLGSIGCKYYFETHFYIPLKMLWNTLVTDNKGCPCLCWNTCNMSLLYFFKKVTGCHIFQLFMPQKTMEL